MNKSAIASEVGEKNDRGVIATLERLTGLTFTALLEGDYCLLKGSEVYGVAQVKVRRRDAQVMRLLVSQAQGLRSHAVTGLAARVVFVMPGGIYVHTVDALELGGWIELAGADLVVSLDVLKMRRLGDANSEWFKE